MAPGKLFRVLLLSYCLALFAGLALERWLVSHSSVTEAPVVPSVDTEPQVKITNTFKLPEFIRLNLVQTQPLFNEDRLPVPEQVEVEQVADTKKKKPKSKQPNLVLTGIVIKDDKQIAIVQDKRTRKSQSMMLGQTMDSNKTEWTLQTVDPRQVVIKDKTQGKEEVLGLDIYVGSLGQARDRENSRKKKVVKESTQNEKQNQDKLASTTSQEEPDNSDKPVNGKKLDENQLQREVKQ